MSGIISLIRFLRFTIGPAITSLWRTLMNIFFLFNHGHEKRIKGGLRFQGIGRTLSCLVTIFLLAGLLPGCGPTHEEIMAKEQERLQREARERQEAEARRQAEESKRQAEQAKQERIRIAVAAGSEAAAGGQLGVALRRLQEALRDIERYSDQDRHVREAIIKVVRAMPAPPPIPEETLRSMTRGEAKLKMGGGGSYEGAAKEMEQAVLAAPWLADGYFNLGIVQEKAEMFGQAIQNFQLCIFAVPQSPNAKAVQAKIYGLEVMREEQEKVKSLAGSWRSSGGNTYKVTIEGRKIRIEGSASDKATDGSLLKTWRVFDLEKKGGSLEGSVSITRNPSNGCSFPIETVPASGISGGDGRFTKISWKESAYRWTWQGKICTGVSSLGKEEGSLELVEWIKP
jgi:tetratricopeptide (TPR) repeat protein